jgi:hypothetical protein
MVDLVTAVDMSANCPAPKVNWRLDVANEKLSRWIHVWSGPACLS